MGENKLRIITGLVFGIIVISCLLLGQWTTVGLFGAFTLMCALEFFKLFQVNERDYRKTVYVLLALLIYLAPMSIIWDIPAGVISLILFFSWLVFASFHFKYSILGSFGLLYISVLFSLVFYFYEEPSDLINPSHWLLLTIILIWTNDVAAYYFGKNFGKHKLISISPKKTIEGAIGGVIAAVVLSSLMLYLKWDIPVWFGVLTGLFIAIAAIFGDLFESMIKRHFNIKDSGNLLPGHGGFLDRLDALLIALPASLLLYKILVV
jgi:phosphatidate cytidylyltransferase